MKDLICFLGSEHALSSISPSQVVFFIREFDSLEFELLINIIIGFHLPIGLPGVCRSPKMKALGRLLLPELMNMDLFIFLHGCLPLGFVKERDKFGKLLLGIFPKSRSGA